jgi:hypothetical protein
MRSRLAGGFSLLNTAAGQSFDTRAMSGPTVYRFAPFKDKIQLSRR